MSAFKELQMRSETLTKGQGGNRMKLGEGHLRNKPIKLKGNLDTLGELAEVSNIETGQVKQS